MFLDSPVKLIVPSTGSVYEGLALVGSNQGVFKCAKNGNMYDGEFSGDKMHGFGKMVYSDGSHYTGQYHNGQKAGPGQYALNNGTIYRGMYVSDKRNGYCECMYSNGHIQRGHSIDSKFHGPGTYCWPDGEVYLGDWVNGLREGLGEDQYVSGNKYIGEWLKSIRHGKARYSFKDGEQRDRLWDNDKESATPCVMTDLLPKVDLGSSLGWMFYVSVSAIYSLKHFYSGC